jgi:hypothetical protein
MTAPWKALAEIMEHEGGVFASHGGFLRAEVSGVPLRHQTTKAENRPYGLSASAIVNNFGGDFR